MKAQLTLLMGTVSVVVGVGCGGSTSSGDLSSPDASQPSPEAATSGPEAATPGPEAASVAPANGDAGGSAFDPTGLGSMLGAVGGADAGPAPSFGVTPQIADGCDTLCAKEATANCPNQGTTTNCALGCRLLLNNPTCSASAMGLFACEGTSTVSCDPTGKASLDDCGVQALSSAACFLQTANDPTIAAPCSTYCTKVAAAACPNDDPTGCQQGCQVIGGFVAACDPLWKAYVTCADGDAGAITCGTDGKAGASGCLLQALAYFACFYGGVSTTLEAGADGAN